MKTPDVNRPEVPPETKTGSAENSTAPKKEESPWGTYEGEPVWLGPGPRPAEGYVVTTGPNTRKAAHNDNFTTAHTFH